jgi:GTPase SAR1 family protein
MTDTDFKSPILSSKGPEPGEFQIAVLGSAGVGKSSLIQRYTRNTFSEEYTPSFIDNINYRFQLANRFGVLSSLRSKRDHRPLRHRRHAAHV